MRPEIARESRLPLIRRPPTRLHAARPVASADIAHTAQAVPSHLTHSENAPRAAQARSIVAARVTHAERTQEPPRVMSGLVDDQLKQLVDIQGRLAILAPHQRPHGAVGSQHRLHRIRRATVMRLHVGAAVEALRMALVLAVHLVCTLCHTTTLAVLPRTRREVGRPTAMDRLRVEDMIRGVSLPLATPLRAAAVALVCSTPVRVRAPHATMQARIGHDAQLTAPSLAIRSDNHRRRQHRAEQRTALRLTAATLF